MFNRREFLAGASMTAFHGIGRTLFSSQASAEPPPSYPIQVDFARDIGPLPHFWEKAAGSDRTVVGLRDQWRKDLVRVRRDTGMQAVRCHGLFDDEMGIATSGYGNFNFLYVDQVYDFMLEHGVRPFVELSFMPEALATSANRIFTYRGNVSPPRRWKDWYDMVHAFTDHCVKRYGIAEVSGWKFEVWNEPNISFWAGSQEQYFELFRQSALAVKSVDNRLQVGGPSTAQLDWIPDLIHYCSTKDVALDFVSSHVYPNDPQKHMFGQADLYSFEQVIPAGIKQVKQQVESSSMPHLPVWITEWSSQNPAFITDTIKNCIGLAEAMSYWTFSNVFEEQGIPTGIFNSSFGLLDQWGIARPSLHAMTFLHRMGDTQTYSDAGPVLATKGADGSRAVLVWNLIPEKEASAMANGNPAGSGAGSGRKLGKELTVKLGFKGLDGKKQVQIRRVGGDIGSALPTWHLMGSPQYPTRDQIEQLRSAAELPKPEIQLLDSTEMAELSLTIPPNGVALLEFAK